MFETVTKRCMSVFENVTKRCMSERCCMSIVGHECEFLIVHSIDPCDIDIFFIKRLHVINAMR